MNPIVRTGLIAMLVGALLWAAVIYFATGCATSCPPQGYARTWCP